MFSLIKSIAPSFMSCKDWAVDYLAIINCRPICQHTKDNKSCSLTHILNALGDTRIGSIKPLDIARVIRDIQAKSPQMAKRVLLEMKDFFSEAVLADVIKTNPALFVKPPKCVVARRRLSLDDWLKIRNYSAVKQPPWVQRMLDLALVTAQRRSDLAVLGPKNVVGDKLYISQVKTGQNIAIPIALKLDAIGKSIVDVLNDCNKYAASGETFIRRASGKQLVCASLSARFEEAREGAELNWGDEVPPSLHECRSLSERLYRAQGVDTRILLGHKHQSMTDVYNDERSSFGKRYEELII